MPNFQPGRREFLSLLGAGACAALTPSLAIARTPATDYRRLLVLVELKGGNDGLNTIVPFADPRYAQLRPRIGLRRDELLPLDERSGAHPAGIVSQAYTIVRWRRCGRCGRAGSWRWCSR